MPYQFKLGALVQLTRDRNEWKATQTELGDILPPYKEGRKETDWSYGPVNHLYVDTDIFETDMDITVTGINVGHITRNLKDGIVIHIDLFDVNGKITSYLKNGNEVWVRVSLKVIFDGSYERDSHIFNI
ncbi:hypothetical protein C8A03DRAFT_32552 [Achaetomium macrosporum]|uniref:Uncharacterized protein n=1 Tax=Achaetomium macrosporum TaxID=79813 RepID=A0AAN7CC93_9PEZI|nr:hypothetical protein C8A03DRAFT_32552 [Achaetomium macrosporum]